MKNHTSRSFSSVRQKNVSQTTFINRLGKFAAKIKVAVAKLNSAGLLQFPKRLSRLSGQADGTQLKLRLGSREFQIDTAEAAASLRY